LRALSLSKLLSACALVIFSFAPVPANGTTDEAVKLLPDKVGDFRALGKASTHTLPASTPAPVEVELVVERSYRSPQGKAFQVGLVKTRTDKEAYALFSEERSKLIPDVERVDGVGTAAAMGDFGFLWFYKGAVAVRVHQEDKRDTTDALKAFARQLAETLDKGEAEVPVLVKHLPDWETAGQQAVYALSLPALQQAAGNRPALEAVNFAGGTEAVTANYGPSQLVIIENTTPQLATDDDARINAKINELKSGGQPIPTAYRRVGNYSVFVFDAPDEASAAQLIDKISYEQVVQWLGNNPHWMERAEREYRQTTAGVILSVIKGTGLSLLICLGIGGIFGSIVFRRRRAQAAMTEAYSDAGGMLRLNLDEMTPQADPSRLLGKGER
jgi:hypothetical protein